MTDAGYTLAETLAALLIIGLAFTGLSEALRVTGLFQTATARTTAAANDGRAVQDVLERLMADAGPFRSDAKDGFSGDANGFRFDCGGAVCEARLEAHSGGAWLAVTDHGDAVRPLPQAAGARFSYLGERSGGASWPPVGPRDRLRAILVVAGASNNESPLASVRLWREQEPRCAFDSIAQDCRPAS